MSTARRLNPADAIAAVLFLVLSLLVLAQPFLGRAPRLSVGDPGPWMLPLICSLGMLGLAIALMVRALRPPRVSPETRERVEAVEMAEDFGPSAEDVAALERRMAPRLAAMALLSVLYVWSFEHLGFYLATGGFLFLAIAFLSERSLRSMVTAALVGILTSGIVGFLLTTYLQVSLPSGPLF